MTLSLDRLEGACVPLFDLFSSAKPGLDEALLVGKSIPRHVAIIMDGNGRWANKRGMPRGFGHRQGVKTLHHIVQAALDMKIDFLTVYAFSTENWKRPEDEVSLLMRLFSEFLAKEIDELDRKSVRMRFIGEVDGLPEWLQKELRAAEVRTAANTRLGLNIAVNYGSRREITLAAKNLAAAVQAGKLRPEDIDEAAISSALFTGGQPDPEILIRTGLDYRISNYLLWQITDAEFFVVDTLWPDFSPADFANIVIEYNDRLQRRTACQVD